MKDINDFIRLTAEATGESEDFVEKVIRSMFSDVQQFTSKKRGVNIQIPHIGTFIFRVNAIPNYVERQKGTLAHWISRLLIGKDKLLPKTVNAAINNINSTFYALNKVSLIKEEFLKKHAKYRPKTKAYLLEDPMSDLEWMDEYIATIREQLPLEKVDWFPEGGVPPM